MDKKNEELRMAKFLVKHTKHTVVVFTAVYSKTAGIKTLYQILGVRGEDFET